MDRKLVFNRSMRASFVYNCSPSIMLSIRADMNALGWKLHPLAGTFKDHWAVSVSGNWRLTFKFEGEDAVLVDYQDYH